MKSTLIVLLFAIANFQCMQTEKVSTKFSQLLNSKTDTANIKFDGVYHNISKDSYHFPTDYKNGTATRYIDSPYLDQPIYFFKNGFLLYEYRLTTLEAKDISLTDDKYQKNFYAQEGWGVYNSSHDTINAIVYVTFLTGWLYQGVAERLQCNFQGELKNNTIMNWRLIPPFPAFNKRFVENANLVKLLQDGINMHYKMVPEKKMIDPNKAWINSLRK